MLMGGFRRSTWALAALSVCLGWASASACGCGTDPLLLAATALTMVVGLQAWRWSAPNGTGDDRMLARTLWGLVVLGLVWLSVNSRGHVLGLGLFLIVLGTRWRPTPSYRNTRSWQPVGVALGVWALIAVSYVVQRQAWLWIPSATSASLALLVGVFSAYRYRSPVPSVATARAWVFIAHAILATSVWAQVSPTAAVWGLVTWPGVLLRWGERTLLTLVLLHGGALTLALWSMGRH